MSIALPALHGRQTVRTSLPTRDLVIAAAITGSFIAATVATAAVGAMPRTGAGILGLGLLGLAGRRRQPLPASVATVVVVISTVLIAPESIKLPVVAAVALVTYSLARYESGRRLLAGLLISAGGVGLARLLLPDAYARGVGIIQLEVVVVLLPALLAALARVRGRLPGLLGPDFPAGPAHTEAAQADDLPSEAPGDPSVDPPARLRPDSGRLASWAEFALANRDRLLCAVAAGLVLLVPLVDGADTGPLARDVVVLALAVVGVASVGLIGRWPLPALVITLLAAVSFSGVATFSDSYDTVIGGVVVIGLPLIVGGLLRWRPALVALAGCGAGIIVMGLVSQCNALPAIGGVTTTSSQVWSSLALAAGAWSTGRVLRSGGLLAWAEFMAPAAVHPAAAQPIPDAGELVQRAGLLGLRPTTIRVDRTYDEPLPEEIGAVVRDVLDEALDNAARHAPGSDLMIKVLREPAAIRIEVINTAAREPTDTAGSGRGVPELANKIAAVGGMFCVGPSSGGFALRARLPVRNVDDLDQRSDASPGKVPAEVVTV